MFESKPNLSDRLEAFGLAGMVPFEEILPLLTEAQSGFALFTMNPEGLINSWTPGAESVFGWATHEVIGESFDRMFTAEDVAAGAAEKELSQATREGQAPDVRWHLRKGGGRVFINGATHRLLNSDGSIAGFLKAGRDQTAQRETEEALRRSREQHRLILENIQDYTIILLDSSGLISGWNPSLEKLTGYPTEDISGCHFSQFYLASDRAAGRPEEDLARAQATGRSETERWRLGKDGSRIWVHEIITPIRDSHDVATGYVAIARDITQQLLAQRESLERERETAQLAERTRVAQELHDTLAQGFTGIRLQIEMAKDYLEADPPSVDVAQNHLRRAFEFTKQSQQEARRSISALRSPLFEDMTLKEALGQLVQQLPFRHAVSFVCSGPPIHLPPDTQRDIFRIAQEALANALRHSQAENVALRVEQNQKSVRMSITDDGQGFREDTEQGGFGLLGMRERAHRIGARLEIASPSGSGTTVVLSWRAEGL